MRIELSAVSLQLPRGATLRLRAVRGLVVHGRGGRLWLTEEGSPDDVFLHAGQTYVVAGGGRVVIGAEVDAALALQARTSRHAGSGARHWPAWLGRSASARVGNAGTIGGAIALSAA